MTEAKTKSSKMVKPLPKLCQISLHINVEKQCHQCTKQFYPLKGFFSNQTTIGTKLKRILNHSI